MLLSMACARGRYTTVSDIGKRLCDWLQHIESERCPKLEEGLKISFQSYQ